MGPADVPAQDSRAQGCGMGTLSIRAYRDPKEVLEQVEFLQMEWP